MVSLARKQIWFRGIFHLIGILGESQFVRKLRKVESAQHSVQWTGGYAARFQRLFSALGFFRFDSESQPTHLPLTRAGGQRLIQKRKEITMPEPLVRALIAHVDSAFEGPNGDYPALLESIANLTAQQALWRPSPPSNSIWQIVDHLTSSKEWQIEMLEKGQAESPAWIQPSGDEESWQTLIAHLKDAHRRQKLALGQLNDEDLLKYPAPEIHRTLLELILSSGSAHEVHHVGQISYLRGLQGA